MRAYLTRAIDAVAKAFGVATVVERASSRSFGVRVMPDQALWYQFQRIGGAMTPGRVTQILRQADAGDMASYVDLLNESRQKDGHLQGILSQAEESISELDWTLKLPETARAKDKRAMRWVENAFRQCSGDADSETIGFVDLIAHLAGAFYVGHQVAEPVFRKDRDGYIAPKGFHAHNARRFGYRTSRFKAEPGRHVVLDVTFQLRLGSLGAPVAYAELARSLGIEVGGRAPAAEVREAVLALRRGKGMVLDPADHDTWSAGSFFTNPVLATEAAEHLPTDAPRFSQPDGSVKTSAAWLISHAGFDRGHGSGAASLSTKHALALTNRGGATTADLLDLAREVRAGVATRFGIELEPEPNLVGCAL